MKEILNRCNKEDYEFLCATLDSYVAFTDDSKRKKLLQESFVVDSTPSEELVSLVDKQIRYYGSSDVAYLVRSIFKEDGGISSHELIDDAAEKLKVKLKISNSLEYKLERLATAVVEKELAAQSAEEIIKSFKEMGVAGKDIELLKEYLKKSGSAIALPIILQILGPKITLKIVQGIITSVITYFIGSSAAKAIVTEIFKKNPILNALGPVVWAVSGTWVAFDLQGPAFRKTIPICLYLGIVGLRNGLEEK